MKTKRLSASRLYDLRLRAGLSQQDVAYELRRRGHKADASAISRWERGVHEPGASAMPSLAEIYGVATDDLYIDEDDEEPSLPAKSLALDLQKLARVAAVLEERPGLLDDLLGVGDATQP